LNIIVIEDHNSLREVIVQTLQNQGYTLTGLPCAEDLDDTAGGECVDIFIVDLNLPNEDGISLTKRIRKANPEVGIIMLTARNRTEDKICGYESGADIYLTKPIEFSELLAAVNSLGRRIQHEQSKKTDLILDYSRLVLQSKTAEIRLKPSEAQIIQALARAKNQQLEYWQLLEILDETEELTEAHLRVKIHRLRQKLVDMGLDKKAIQNAYQKGYQLCIALEIR
jgi:DNA-binding response OmpR family regulator